MDNHWILIYEFIKKRILEPLKNPSYVMYFVIIILFVNSIGIIKDLISYEYCITCSLDRDLVRNFTLNLTNIGLSLTTASIIDLIFISRNAIKIETEQEKYRPLQIESIKKSVRIFGLCSLIIIFIIWILVNSFISNNLWKIVFSVIGLIFSFVIWWISNVRNKILHNKFDVFVTLGKKKTINFDNEKVNSQVESESSLKGDISNFKVD